MNQDIFDAQEVLKEAGMYSGVVDGVSGPRTRAAISISEENGKHSKRWGEARRIIAAMQRELNKMGFNAGNVDGIRGKKTDSALMKFREEKKEGNKDIETENSTSIITIPPFTVPRRRIHAEMVSAYGQPGDGNQRNSSGKVLLPFPFVVAWNKSQKVNSFRAHERVAPVFQSIFENAANHYGEDEYRRLGLDLFGGCYNARRMRGGVSWSTHAWGVAVDLDPERNQLKWNKNRASFARPDYIPFWNIVEAHKCVSLGRARDYDWMHFQLAKET